MMCKVENNEKQYFLMLLGTLNLYICPILFLQFFLVTHYIQRIKLPHPLIISCSLCSKNCDVYILRVIMLTK